VTGNPQQEVPLVSKRWEQESTGNGEGTLGTTVTGLESLLGMGWVESLECCAGECDLIFFCQKSSHFSSVKILPVSESENKIVSL